MYSRVALCRIGVTVAAMTLLSLERLAIAQQSASGLPPATRSFESSVLLERTSETSANASLADLDGSGDLDIILAKGRHWPLENRVLLNQGHGEFKIAVNLGAQPDRTYSAVLADWDGDGDIDVAVSNDRPDGNVIYLNDGAAHFTPRGTWGDSKWATRNAAAADFNGDRYADIVVANRGGTSYVCLNDQHGSFPIEDCVALPVASATTIIPADFNNDGSIDLAMPHRDGGQSLIGWNEGQARFTQTSRFGPSDSRARAAAAEDLNQDGWADLVVGDQTHGIRVYLNDQHSGFSEGISLGDGRLSTYAIAISDMNRDGTPDIVVGYADEPSSVFFNFDSGGRFEEVRFGDGRGAVYGLALGDLNGDGFQDIVAARSGAPNVAYFSGSGEASTQAQTDVSDPR